MWVARRQKLDLTIAVCGNVRPIVILVSWFRFQWRPVTWEFGIADQSGVVRTYRKRPEGDRGWCGVGWGGWGGLRKGRRADMSAKWYDETRQEKLMLSISTRLMVMRPRVKRDKALRLSDIDGG